jgi:hypothetical protein
MQSNFDTPTYLLNQGTSSTVPTPSFSQLQSNFLTNVIAFNQSRFFQKNAVALTEAQVEINGLPVYPFPQPPHLIKCNILEALDLEGNIHAADYPGLQSLEQWTRFGFIQAVSFEHRDAWKNGIISGYPNPTSNLLKIRYSPTFSNNTNELFILAFAERVVNASFIGSAASIEYLKNNHIYFFIKTSKNALSFKFCSCSSCFCNDCFVPSISRFSIIFLFSSSVIVKSNVLVFFDFSICGFLCFFGFVSVFNFSKISFCVIAKNFNSFIIALLLNVLLSIVCNKSGLGSV